MAKHFGLKSFVPQNNNYVVFDEYFNNTQGRDIGLRTNRFEESETRRQTSASLS